MYTEIEDAFLGGEYVRGIRENPFSLQSYLSDPVNAPRHTAANQARAAGHRGAQGFLAATRGDTGLYGGQDDTGGGMTPEEAARLAQHVGQTEYGFEEHTVAPDTATNEAIQGRGYTGSGAAPAGSQFLVLVHLVLNIAIAETIVSQDLVVTLIQ